MPWHLKYLNTVQASNAVASIAVIKELKLPEEIAKKTISNLKPLPGRGQKITINFKNNQKSLLIDDSYNANPDSMYASLSNLYKTKSKLHNYKTVLIIGDMLELGKKSMIKHLELIPIIKKINPNLLITVGFFTELMSKKLEIKSYSYPDIDSLILKIKDLIKPNQLILIKGSNGSKVWKLVKILQNLNQRKLMLPDLLLNYTEYFQPLNLFNYITFRSIGALLTALIISLVFGQKIIFILKKFQKKGQPIRSDGPQSHIITKSGTPTMGGLLILFAFTISTILWAKLDNIYIWIILGVALSFGLIGLLDDWLKVSKMSSNGLKSYQKIIPQILVAFVAAWFIGENTPPNYQNSLSIPLLKRRFVFYRCLVHSFYYFSHSRILKCCKLNRWLRWACNCSCYDCS